ncbi:MAG: type 4a pilus biogenesis protein PilO [Nitrospirae bacterium]|nr:type 4a pilus biogenesis protein PilO [Nitrospirota bacterium]
MALKLDLKTLPSYVRVILSLLPSVIVAVAIIMLAITPKQKEIKVLDKKIDEQNNQIAESQAKGAKLEILMRENERLLNRLNELKEQLPEEKEISSLLKQVSDLSISAGLEMKSWKPSQKVMHSSGIVYEIPVSVSVSGTYHDLGGFLSSLTKLNRIVNVNNLKMGTPKVIKGSNLLEISFTAATYSAVPEAEIAQKDTGKKDTGKKEAVKK